MLGHLFVNLLDVAWLQHHTIDSTNPVFIPSPHHSPHLTWSHLTSPLLTGPINNFFYDQGSSDAPVQDDPSLEDYNVQWIVDTFVEECLEQAEVYRTVRDM